MERFHNGLFSVTAELQASIAVVALRGDARDDEARLVESNRQRFLRTNVQIVHRLSHTVIVSACASQYGRMVGRWIWKFQPGRPLDVDADLYCPGGSGPIS